MNVINVCNLSIQNYELKKKYQIIYPKIRSIDVLSFEYLFIKFPLITTNKYNIKEIKLLAQLTFDLSSIYIWKRK